MRKSWKSLLFVTSLAFVALFAACGTDDNEEDPNGTTEDPTTVEVHFYNSENWDEVYVESDDHDDLSDGLQADAEAGEENWFSVEFEREVLRNPITITFTDNGDNASESLEIDHPNQVYTTIYSDGVFGSRGGAEDFMNTTLSFYNSEGWDAVHVSSDDVAMLSDNPEVTVNPDQENWYSIQVPVNLSKSSITVTFNDGTVANGTATTLDNPTQTYLTVQEDGLYGSYSEAEAKVSGNFTEVYFYNTAGWEVVTAHYWGNDNLEGTSWPGASTTAVEGHENWVKVIVPDVNPGDEFMVIFNNNDEGAQTGNTEISNAEDLYLTFNQPDGDTNIPASKYSSFDDAENPSVRVNFFNDQNWDTVEVSATDGEAAAIDGVTIEQDGDSLYYTVEVPQSAMEGTVNLTFSDGDSTVSDEITLTDDNKNLYLTTDAALTYSARNTLWFYNADGWSTVHTDVETDEDTPRTILDGVQATQDGDTDYWKVDIPTDFDNESYNVTFTDGDTNQSDVLAVNDSNVSHIFTTDETITYTARTTITFYNSEGWSTVNADIKTAADTPRTMFDGAATQDGDTAWWSVEIPTNFDSEAYNVTFTDGDTNSAETVTLNDGSQTVLTMTADERYNNVDQAETWMNAEEGDYTTLWFYNSEGWTDMNAYIFGEYQILGAWPGMALTQDGDTDWWSIDIPADFSTTDFTIILNGADGNQTSNIPLENNTDVFITADGGKYADKAAAEEAMAMDPIKVYFYNSEGWTDINGYNFSDGAKSDTFDEVLGGWPGTAAIQDGDTDWWYVEIPVDFTEDFIPATDTEDAKGFKLIFNGSLNGDDIQTGNILLENMTDVYITADSQVFDNEADAETAMAQPEGTLIISEYVEGSANNKALEIYNATGAEVDLTLYSLMLYANGDTETDMSYDLTGTLAADETLVIVNSSADQALLDVADVTNSYPDTAVSFNGNDAITLLNDGTVIDVFGTVGEEGTVGDNNNWAIGDDAAAEFTLVRDPSVSSGVTVFDGSQWIVHPQDTFDKLGSHTLN